MTVARHILKSLPKLPVPELWPTTFKVSKARGQLRVSVMSEDTADLAAKTMGIQSHPNRSIIEIYPGPGQLTRSMALAGAKKIVTVENGETYQKSLQLLEENSEGRIQHFPLNPYMDPFDELLDPKKNLFPGLEQQPWDKVHSDLMLVGSVPNSSLGEKVLLDLLMASVERMSIFKMGRVEMYLFCSKEAIKRLVAAPGTPTRGRTTLLAEAAAEISSVMRPGPTSFHLPYDYELVRFVPHEKPKMETSIEVLDFCLRSLFTNKSHALSKVIKLLGPGADILLGRLSFDQDVKIKHMTLDQLNEVALKFEQWPLRPTVLYDDMIMHENKRKR
ncbi:Mitochondrial transcription factor 1 [Entomortierella chlamydospora]|uniref:rRNA adenine N(6)-methyltransferase n=1 Tax=Entomortierella chlamydospora TaxID=101097 RepID=A0A9P6MRS4_9FUNG|nr:Mitochondrial transcription factor 1 [Entomortierella chlamydospora]KAG0011380.1 Mitochondrial transcription factor 1 [Entomortierella chlamydospora]